MFKKTDERIDRFIEAARANLGYVSRPNQESYYGSKVGYTGVPWSGAFIDVVAREAGLVIPRCTYTPAGMAEFVSQRRFHSRPRPGDIVFFSFPTGDNFDMPHCGIVTRTDDWEAARKFGTIEGQVASGLPRGGQTADGVYERARYGYDVIGFGRPAFQERQPVSDDGLETGQPILISRLRPAKGKRSRDVGRVQLALVAACGLVGYEDGMWDAPTRAAFSSYQRRLGYALSDVTGMPDETTLRLLGKSTGIFHLK